MISEIQPLFRNVSMAGSPEMMKLKGEYDSLSMGLAVWELCHIVFLDFDEDHIIGILNKRREQFQG